MGDMQGVLDCVEVRTHGRRPRQGVYDNRVIRESVKGDNGLIRGSWSKC